MTNPPVATPDPEAFHKQGIETLIKSLRKSILKDGPSVVHSQFLGTLETAKYDSVKNGKIRYKDTWDLVFLQYSMAYTMGSPEEKQAAGHCIKFLSEIKGVIEKHCPDSGVPHEPA